MMEKLDLKKQMKNLYNPSAKEVQVVEVPAMKFLMVDGQGDPNTSQDYQDAIQALFSLSYTIKFMLKKGEAALDYGVMPLEGLWWSDNLEDFITGEKNAWKWTAIMMQPDFITQETFEKALAEVKKKKDVAAIDKVRFETFEEGLAVQIMYIGPFAAEKPTIDKLHAFIEDNGYERCGKHHEIYLSDFRKCAPEKLKTVIRQPMRKR